MTRRRGKKNKYNNRLVYIWERYPYTTFNTKDAAYAWVNEGAVLDTGDLIKFDSTGEYNRFIVLYEELRDGTITDLRLQPRYKLQPEYRIGKSKKAAINYDADFSYMRDGVKIIEDYKGMRTAVFNLKWRMMHYKFRAEIEAGTIELKITQ